MILTAASIPEATAEAFSNRVWIQGTRQEVVGYGEETISMQPVAFDMMTFRPRALVTSLIARASPQPIQARWPGARYSFCGNSRGTNTAKFSTG